MTCKHEYKLERIVENRSEGLRIEMHRCTKCGAQKTVYIPLNRQGARRCQ